MQRIWKRVTSGEKALTELKDIYIIGIGNGTPTCMTREIRFDVTQYYALLLFIMIGANDILHGLFVIYLYI